MCWYPKTSEHLKQTQLYEKHSLDYAKLDRIFVRSKSLPNFAVNLALHFFDASELMQGFDIDGPRNLPATQSVSAKRRFEIIREIVEENFIQEESLWPRCVVLLNKKIRQLNNKSQSAS